MPGRTDRQKAGAEIGSIDQLLIQTLDSLDEAFFMLDSAWHFIFFNRCAERLSGRTRESLLGLDLWEEFPHTRGTVIEDFYRQALSSGKSGAFEVFYPPLAIWIEMHLYPTTDGGLAVHLRDISARKQAEQAMKEQAALLDLSQDAILLHRYPEGRIEYWNHGAELLYGWNAAEAMGCISHTLLRTRFPMTLSEILDSVSQEGQWEGELHHISRDGRNVVVWSRWVLQRDAEGRPIALLETNTDVTAQRAIDEERAKLYARERVLATITEAGLTHLDLSVLLPEVLARTTTALGVDNTAFLLLSESREYLKIYLAHGPEAEIAGQVRVPLGQGIAGRIAATGESLVLDDTSKAHPVNPFLSQTIHSLMGAPVAIGGQIIGVLHAGTLVPRHFTQEDLRLLELAAGRIAMLIERANLFAAERQARLAAEQALSARDVFLSDAAHELKTPLASLRGFTSLLIKGVEAGNGEQSRNDLAFQGILRQTERMTGLVTRLLDLARFESGQFFLERSEMDLTALAQDVIIAAKVRTTDHTLSLVAPGPLRAKVDALRIEQILTNLVENAIKFSPNGGSIQIVLTELADDHRSIQIAVHDQGLGVPLEKRGFIFGRLGQAHAETYRSGLGLGLYISRQIAEMHGGRLDASFPDEGGSIFALILPRHRQ